MTAIMDFQLSIFQLFKEIQGWNLDFKLFTPKIITGTIFRALATILHFVEWPYLNCLESYLAEIEIWT